MIRIVWRIVGMGFVSAVALGCGGDAEQDERVVVQIGGTGGGLTGGEGGTGQSSAAGASGSGGSAAGGAGGVTGGTGGIGTAGASGSGLAGEAGGVGVGGGPGGAGGASGGNVGQGGVGIAAGDGGSSGGSLTSGAGGSVTSGAGGAGGSVTSGAGGAGGSVTSGAGGSVTGGAGGAGGSVTSGAGGAGGGSVTGGAGAAGEAGAGGGSGGMSSACSEPTEAVRVLQQGWWLCGWFGGLDHYSWMYFGAGDQMGTLGVLDATCSACTSYFGCAGTDGEYSAAASRHSVVLAMPSGCSETGWTVWAVTEICPPDGYPAGSSAYVTLTDGTNSLRCNRYPLDQCDATLSSCPMPP